MSLDLFIDPAAPIKPDIGLGGLRLRTPVADLQTVLNLTYAAHFPSMSWFSLIGVFEARYQLEFVSVFVDVRNGRIFKLAAEAGYSGVLFEGIHVGMLVDEALQLDARLYYDEAEELILVQDVPGVALEVDATDPDPAHIARMPIAGISVYAREIMTEKGQSGLW